MKVRKQSLINMRVTSEQKKEIENKAKKLNMTTTKFLLYMAENGHINVLHDGDKLLKEVYNLNKILSNFERHGYNSGQSQKLRDIISQSITQISNVMEVG